MVQVRDSESKLKNSKSQIKESQNVSSMALPMEPEIEEEVLNEESLDVEDNFVSEVAKIECLMEEPEAERIPEPTKKKQKAMSCLPASLVYSHHELEELAENNQNVIVLNTTALTLERPVDGKNFEFDSSWLHHSDQAFIYKCKYCIKAFSNAEFLMKHTISSHLCLLCLKVVDNYKELTIHAKEHSNIECQFCGKSCGASINYRQHLKKHHFLSLPNHIGILG
jgi:Zinc finger, C2H2 type